MIEKTIPELLVRWALVILLVSSLNCSYHYVNPGLEDFSEATQLIGKNLIYVFEQLQEEEMNLRILEVTQLETIKPTDLEPKVLTFYQLEKRKNLVDFIKNYTKLLASVFTTIDRDDITKNAKTINQDLIALNENHDGFLSESELGLMTSLAHAIPEAMSFTKKRYSVLKIMKEIQPVLEKIVDQLTEETIASQSMMENFFSRQFMHQVADDWPAKKSQRLKYSKLGVKIIKKKHQMEIIFDDVLEALAMIPKTHRQLRRSVKSHKNPVYGLKELINYAYRIQKYSEDYSK